MLNGMASGAKEDDGETGGAEAGPGRGTGT
ncbi:TetR family transcriptional regulator, partial [Streptomyces sp. SID8380]|nr:TetR family transcriptional regulator [Streptomyces sp. SID8380]